MLVHLRHDGVVRGRGVTRRSVPHPGRCGAVGHGGEVRGVGGVTRHHLTLRWRRGHHLVVGWVAVSGRVAGRQIVVREVRVVRVVSLRRRARHTHGRMLAVV